MQPTRFFLLTSFLLFFSLSLRGQTGNISTNLKNPLKRADQLFEQYAYHSAVDWYRQALKKDTANEVITLRIAECYRKLNDSKQAEVWYAKALSRNKMALPATKLYYAQALQRNGNYSLALRWYAYYLEAEAKDGRAYNQLESLYTPSQYFRDSAFYHVQELGINTPSPDFAASFYQQGIVFVSAQRKASLLKRVSSWDDNPLLDLYYSTMRTDGSMSRPQSFDRDINSPVHEGPATFYDQDRKMIFTRSNYLRGQVQKSANGVNKLKLFYAERSADGKKWNVTDPFPFNSNEYSVGHPAISRDGKTVYFVSDMPGGFGGLDLYVSTFENGAWGVAKNLGKAVNTEGNEMFPFIDEEQMLYFSSDGHGGLGGLDICKMDLRSPSDRAAVIHVGYPVNTASDDFAFILDTEGEGGYFSSNRKEGKGNDDLYKMAFRYLKIEGTVADAKTNEILQDASVRVFDSRTGAELKGRQQGPIHLFKTFPGHGLIVKAHKENYQDQTLFIPTHQQLPGQVIPLHIRLEKIPLAFTTLRLHCFEEKSGKPLSQAEVYVLNELTSDEQVLKTDEKGNLTFQAATNGSYAIIAQQGDHSGMLTGLQPDSVSASIIQLATVIQPTAEKNKEVLLEVSVRDLLHQQPVPGVSVYLQEGLLVKQQAITQGDGKTIFKVSGQPNVIVRANHSLYESKMLGMPVPPSTGDTMRMQLVLESVKPKANSVVNVYENGANNPEKAVALQREIDAVAKQLDGSNLDRPGLDKPRKLLRDASSPISVGVSISVVDAVSNASVEGAVLKFHGQQPYESIAFTKQDGMAKLPMEVDKIHVLTISKDGYRPKSVLVPKQSLPGQVIPLHIRLEKIPPAFTTLRLHCFEEKSGKPLAQAEVYLLNELTSDEQLLKTDEKGNLTFQAATNGSYAIIAQQGDHSGMLTSLQPDSVSASVIQLVAGAKVAVEQSKEVVLEVSVRDMVSQQPVPGASVYLQEGLLGKQKAITQADGKARFSIQPQQHYVIKTSKSGYAIETSVVSTRVNSPVILAVQVNLEKPLPTVATLYLHCFEAKSGKPLAQAEVYVLNELTSDEQLLQADEKGNVALKVASDGSFSMVAEQGNLSGMVNGIVLTSLAERIDIPAYSVRKAQEVAETSLLSETAKESKPANTMAAAVLPRKDAIPTKIAETPRSTNSDIQQQLKAAIAEVAQVEKSPPAINGIEVYITDARTKALLEGVKVKLFEQTTIKHELVTGKDGHIQLATKPDRIHILQLSREGYHSQSIPLPLADHPLTHTGQPLRIALQPQFAQLRVHFYDAKTKQPFVGAKVYVLNELTSEEQDLKTDEKGNVSVLAKLDGSYAIIGEKGALSGMLTGISPNDSAVQHVRIPAYPSTKAQEAGYTMLVKVKVVNATGETLSGVQLQLLAGSKQVQVKPGNQSDTAVFQVPLGSFCVLKAQKPGFENKVMTVSTQVVGENNGEGLFYTVILLAEKPKAIRLHAQFYDAQTKKPLAGAKVYVLNEFTSEEQHLKADEKGLVSFPGSPDGSYAIIGEKGTVSGMLTGISSTDAAAQHLRIPAYPRQKAIESSPTQTVNVVLVRNTGLAPQILVGSEEGVYQFNGSSAAPALSKISGARALRVPKLAHTVASPVDSVLTRIVEMGDLQQTNLLVVNSIHYGLNKSLVRGNDLPELDKLVQLMKANPWMKLTLQSHADSRQTSEYNYQLTIRRAQAAINYLVAKGIAKKRLSFKAFGESKLLNRCADGVACDEEAHSINRRAELIILY